MVTIKDVAKEAKVSVSTVSYVLNNIKTVKPSTLKRIRDAVQKLNYQPNHAARALKTKKSLSIGIIVPDISNLFFIEIIRGIEDIANKYQYTVFLCNTDEDEQKEIRYLTNLMQKDIDGLVFVGTGKNEFILKNVMDVPVVIVDRKLGNNYSSVMVDNIKGGFLATDHLLRRNQTEVFFLTGPLVINTYYERLTGYIQALKSFGLEYNESLVHEAPVNLDGAFNTARSLLAKNKMRSIFAANDIIALGVMKAVMQENLKIPEDVAVVGYDDIPISSIVFPAMTTISQPKYLMGVRAAELIFAKIKDPETQNAHILLEPHLVIRETA